jgi:tetratricopeptide (TPR) repeat protein
MAHRPLFGQERDRTWPDELPSIVKTLKPPLRRSLRVSHFLFATVFLLRLIVLSRLTSSPFLVPNSGDMQFYNAWAQRILHGQFIEQHAFYGLPLYAYLLASLYTVFGYSPFIPGFLQAVLEGGTAVLIYNIAVRTFGGPSLKTTERPLQNDQSLSRHFGEWVGILAALGWGFFMPAEAYSAVLMPTAGLVFVFWYVVWQIVRRRELPHLSGLLLLGALIGFTAMGVATILFLVPLLVAAIFFKWQLRHDAPGKWLRAVAAAVVFIGIAIGASPCWIHNYFVANDPVFLSAHSGVNFWIGNNPIATGYPRFPPGLHAGQKAMLEDSISTAEEAAGRPLKRAEVSAYWSAKAKSYIKNNFGRWLKLVAVKIGNFWNAFQYDDLSIITILLEQKVILPGLKFGLVAALAIPGFLFALKKFPLSRWVAAAIFVHMVSLLMVFVTERYRLAAVPGLLLSASFGVVWLWQNLAHAKYSRVALYLAVLAAATLFISIPQKDPGLWALDAYNAGWQALQSKNLTLAEKKLQVAYAYAPDNSEVNFATGNLRLAQGKIEEAKAAYGASLRLNPRNPGALNNLGLLALQDRQWHLAQTFLEKAVQEEPQDAKTHYLLAKARFGAGDSNGANVEIEKALDLVPDQSDFLKLREEIREGPIAQSQ